MTLLTAGRSAADMQTDRDWSRAERKWRHEWRALIAGVQREGAALTADSVVQGGYPTVPSCWNCYEVPWGFYAESPRAALLWGTELAAAPYRAEETPRERGPLANALWSAVMSQWAQSVAGELLAEAEGAAGGAESGDTGRLWWLPGALLGGMRDIGAYALCAGDLRKAEKLRELLVSIPRVQWSAIDPSWVRRPRDNHVMDPIFASGDFVSWDPVSWTLAVDPFLLFPSGSCDGPWGLDVRGPPLVGSLKRYRERVNGLAVTPGGWRGVPYADIRAVPEIFKRRPGRRPSSFPPGCDVSRPVPAQKDGSGVGYVVEGDRTDDALSKMSGLKTADPKGSAVAGSTARPIVLVDLEAGVLVEEVDSEGEGILPSAWNRKGFVGKQEDEPLASGGPSRHWLCDVEEGGLRAVLRSSECDLLLSQLGFSPVTEDEELGIMVSLVGEIKEIYDKPPVREPGKRRLARKLLEHVHAATHREMDSAAAVERVTAELSAKREALRRAESAEQAARVAEYERAKEAAEAERGFEKSPGSPTYGYGFD